VKDGPPLWLLALVLFAGTLAWAWILATFVSWQIR
jgi:hypothetical protein